MERTQHQKRQREGLSQGKCEDEVVEARGRLWQQLRASVPKASDERGSDEIVCTAPQKAQVPTRSKMKVAPKIVLRAVRSLLGVRRSSKIIATATDDPGEVEVVSSGADANEGTLSQALSVAVVRDHRT